MSRHPYGNYYQGFGKPEELKDYDADVHEYYDLAILITELINLRLRLQRLWINLSLIVQIPLKDLQKQGFFHRIKNDSHRAVHTSNNAMDERKLIC